MQDPIDQRRSHDFVPRITRGTDLVEHSGPPLAGETRSAAPRRSRGRDRACAPSADAANTAPAPHRARGRAARRRSSCTKLAGTPPAHAQPRPSSGHAPDSDVTTRTAPSRTWAAPRSLTKPPAVRVCRIRPPYLCNLRPPPTFLAPGTKYLVLRLA